MARFKIYHKRMRFVRWRSEVLAVFFMILFFPTFCWLEDGEIKEVYRYTISVNGTQVGITEDVETAERCFIEARRKAAEDTEGMLLSEVDMTYTENNARKKDVNEDGDIISNMVSVILKNRKEMLNKAYTVKINEYVVNLASLEEVDHLLQAALDRYDTEHRYSPFLTLDNTREMAVMTATAVTGDEETARDTQMHVEDYFSGVGIFEDLNRAFYEAEPAGEKEFSDYELGLISMQFADNIEVVEAYLQDSELTDLNVAISEVTKDQEKEGIYEVQSGDTLSQIAEKSEIPLARLVAMNPTLEDENSMIRVGDELIITVPQPELSVNRWEQAYYEEDYEADIIYVNNDSWYTTDTKTLQEPSAGHRKVVAIISYYNNEKIGVDIQKQEITYEAVPKIVERGTKIPPTYMKPISGGRLSSGFGKRTQPTKGASTYHKGIDWATPVGTAVMASSAGIVTKAGWGRGYGYVIYVRHSDGKETRYGHLSKILVSPGQIVSQGQKIALSGNTGVSTGPHVHFEILVNGAQVDPFKYLK